MEGTEGVTAAVVETVVVVLGTDCLPATIAAAVSGAVGTGAEEDIK